MAPPQSEHAEPGEEVEVRVAFAIEEVGALGADPLAIEPERAEHARHLRMDVALLERVALVPACGKDCPEVEPVLTGRRLRRARRAPRRLVNPVSQQRHCASRSRSYTATVSPDRSRSNARPEARRMRSARAGFTNPCSKYHTTARTSASRAGMLEYPSSVRARLSSYSMRVLAMRTGSDGRVGSRRSTVASAHSALRTIGITTRGCNRTRGAAKPQMSASVASSSRSDMFSPPRM